MPSVGQETAAGFQRTFVASGGGDPGIDWCAAAKRRDVKCPGARELTQSFQGPDACGRSQVGIQPGASRGPVPEGLPLLTSPAASPGP